MNRPGPHSTHVQPGRPANDAPDPAAQPERPSASRGLPLMLRVALFVWGGAFVALLLYEVVTNVVRHWMRRG